MRSLHLMRNFDAIICHCVTSVTSSHLLHTQHLVVRTLCCFPTPSGHISWSIRSLLPHAQDLTALADRFGLLSVSTQSGIWSDHLQILIVMTPIMVRAGHQERKLPSGGHQPHPHPQLEQPDGALVAPDCHQQEGASRSCICWVCASHTHCDCCTPTV